MPRSIGLLLSLLLLLTSPAASARATSQVPYTLAESYSAAVRFVRIDKGCRITDKDPDTAFVTFECSDDGHTRRGSLEIIRETQGGRERARLQLTLGDDPHYVELRWLELLERKLRDERGTPPPAPAPPAPKPAPDAGT